MTSAYSIARMLALVGSVSNVSHPSSSLWPVTLLAWGHPSQCPAQPEGLEDISRAVEDPGNHDPAFPRTSKRCQKGTVRVLARLRRAGSAPRKSPGLRESTTRLSSEIPSGSDGLTVTASKPNRSDRSPALHPSNSPILYLPSLEPSRSFHPPPHLSASGRVSLRVSPTPNEARRPQHLF